jgi:hypothetical protein
MYLSTYYWRAARFQNLLMFLSFTTGAASAAGTAYSCVLSFSEVRDAQSLALCNVW